MRKTALCLVLALMLAFVVSSVRSANAGAGDAPAAATAPTEAAASAPSNPSDDDVTRGVWNNGQAVFSDISALDIFWRFARGYKPEQPIHYSHKLHMEKNHMECQYCHSGVNKSPYATIPSVELCMGCHKIPTMVPNPNSPEIAKLKKAFDEKKPVEWVPVNNLPEHVNFTHERHVKAGVSCQNCHGQVQKMDVVEKVASLKMGFCVTCHREKGASIDCWTCHR